ncbi:MAG: UTP--glucose-1-phosphate uridylyltransferase [Candidatus Dependentiae bacterium]|nr:UTP--glucose-1-phosphate uridylyltransferase [Candidatus Dependentiae bacterium]
MELRKVVIPAAGLGTGFLPYTKAVPKEMLPIIDKPVIHHIFEECIASEMTEIFVVVSSRKNAIADHVDSSADLEAYLAERGQMNLLTSTQRLARMASYAFIRQSEPLGSGHAVSLAQHCIGKEYFAIVLPDDFIDAQEPTLKHLMRIARQEKTSIVAVQEIPQSAVSTHNVISIKKTLTSSLLQVADIVEQPSQRDAPSTLALVGRMIISHKIFAALEYANTHSEKREISLASGISQMIRANERVLAYKIPGIRYDLRNPLGWLKAVVGMGLKNPAYAPHLHALIEDAEPIKTVAFSPARMVEQGR